MRFRGKSIRRKIVALLLVPLLSLAAIWAFATVITGRQASQLFQARSVAEKVAYPAEDVVRALQQERRQSLVHLADPRDADGLAALRRSRTATDRSVAALRRDAQSGDVREALDAGSGGRLGAVLDALGALDSLRRSVEDRTVDRAEALSLYDHLVDPCYVLLASLHVIDDANLDKQYRALVNLARARELLSREDALLGSSLVVGAVTHEESRALSDLVAQRSMLYDISLPMLPAPERSRYYGFWANASSVSLRAAEQAAASTASGAPRGVTAESWGAASAGALDGLAALDDQARDHYQDQVRPVAMNVILQAAVAGVLGLIAVLFSLFLSVRVGRALIRDLRQLRLEAHEASGVRLPGVMRRLSAGEKVDVETEVPRLEYDKNEIGEVGQALNTLQRAAVEAAVKQAELRAGVSEVFVNLARRSQVLLHKQLTLLDAMERRTEDTEELADLFRLDHLTTRMRRHAEGLVILSGAAPSRQWRRPVRLMDVVRAAVAEVEDYERVEVRRLPGVALTGPAVADLTHLIAELLENATVFSPPHTAVQVVGERVANGFTLEIHDRGLGMAAETLLDANLRLAETPEFELSDTDRLGLFVISRLAQRQNVRVSLQPSPYGGTTAVVFLPDALLTDDAADTNGVGFRLDRGRAARRTEREDGRRAALSSSPVQLPGLPVSLLDGPVELGSSVELEPVEAFPDVLDALDDEDGEDGAHGGLFRQHRPGGRPQTGETPGRTAPRQSAGLLGAPERGARGEEGDGSPIPLPRRHTPKLVSSHGRPVGQPRSRAQSAEHSSAAGGDGPETEVAAPLPTRRRGETPLGRSAPAADASGTRDAGAARGAGAARDVRAARDAGGPGDDRAADAAGRPHARGGSPATGRSGAAAEPPALPQRRRAAPARGGPDSPDRDPAAPGEPATAAPDRDHAIPGEPATGAVGEPAPAAPGQPAPPAPEQPAPDAAALPRRVRQASLAPQLKETPERPARDRTHPAERDADEVRSRMASLQRGWQRGREENAADDAARGAAAPGTTGTAPGTTKGDGR
ncbi:nitrate- and nitrite sensing domain-containing protein [Streptomyces sp. NPDC046985]|uniref:nitrate- and nitrite sensing domain-containing protein n=1 Tax=Streptomyces sp. NPDC046985 TaxID=3155377 RepID=UPI0033CDA992